MLKLRLINLWIQDSRIFVNWDKESRTILHEIFIELRATIQSLLPPHCTHIKNRGGVKGSVRWHLKEAIKRMNEIVSSLGLLLHPKKRFIPKFAFEF